MLLKDLTLLPLSLPAREVGVLEGRLRERRGTVGREGLVEDRKFLKKDSRGPAVGDNVMHGQEQDMVLFTQLQHSGPHQGTSG